MYFVYIFCNADSEVLRLWRRPLGKLGRPANPLCDAMWVVFNSHEISQRCMKIETETAEPLIPEDDFNSGLENLRLQIGQISFWDEVAGVIYGKIDEKLAHILARKHSNVHTYWFGLMPVEKIPLESLRFQPLPMAPTHLDTYEIQIWTGFRWTPLASKRPESIRVKSTFWIHHFFNLATKHLLGEDLVDCIIWVMATPKSRVKYAQTEVKLA